ncbi:MAG: transposase [Bacillota bacterium]
MSNATYNPKVIRNYKFRIYPTKKQVKILLQWLTLCRICYNSALADRKNRTKAKLLLAKVHEKIRHQRMDYLHKVSNYLTWKYGKVIAEDLKIQNMMKNHHLAKSIADAGWGYLFSMLSYKAESAGRDFERVIAYGSSQECSQCGATVKKDLAQRVHRCPGCGLVADRDLNAARVLEKRAS